MPSASPAVPSTRRRHQTASTKKRRLPVDHPPARALLMLPPFFWQYVPLPALALLLTRFQVTLYGGPTSRGSDTAMLPSAAALRVRTLHARPQPEARSGMPRGERDRCKKSRRSARRRRDSAHWERAIGAYDPPPAFSLAERCSAESTHGSLTPCNVREPVHRISCLTRGQSGGNMWILAATAGGEGSTGPYRIGSHWGVSSVR